MTWEELVYSVVCPTCGVEPDDPCVYLWPKGVSECAFHEGSDECYKHSPGQHERMARAGTPTKAPHHSRNRAANKRKVREQRLAEQKQLREWLDAYGDIFAIG